MKREQLFMQMVGCIGALNTPKKCHRTSDGGFKCISAEFGLLPENPIAKTKCAVKFSFGKFQKEP